MILRACDAVGIASSTPQAAAGGGYVGRASQPVLVGLGSPTYFALAVPHRPSGILTIRRPASINLFSALVSSLAWRFSTIPLI